MTDIILEAARGNYVPPALSEAPTRINSESEIRAAWTAVSVALLHGEMHPVAVAAKRRLLSVVNTACDWHDFVSVDPADSLWPMRLLGSHAAQDGPRRFTLEEVLQATMAGRATRH